MLLFFLIKIILEYGNFGGPGNYGGMPPQFNVPPPTMGGGGGYPGPAQGANFGGPPQQQGGYSSGGGGGGGGASGGNQGKFNLKNKKKIDISHVNFNLFGFGSLE